MPQLYTIHGDNALEYDGWVVHTFGIGHDPTHHGGADMRGRRIPIARLNDGYPPTIPEPEFYADFAQRCANFVEASQGCTRWIIGNEPNHRQETDGQPITPTMYAECYTLCRNAIRALDNHEHDEVLVAAIAPWNVDTKYTGNPTGDWLRYFEDVQRLVDDCDGFAIHTYAREQTPESITDTARMDSPFEFAYKGFLHYTNWMDAILPDYRGLPVYLTEFCVAGKAWENVDTGCIVAAYSNIDTWNMLYPGRPIHCLTVYRWSVDEWSIDDKPNVHEDFYNAVERGYSWPRETEPPIEPPEENTLKNRSLEQPYYRDSEHSTVEVASGWAYFASDGVPPERDGPCQLPEYKALNKSQDERRVWDGQTAQCWFIRWKIFDAGIFQTVDVEPGAAYQFDAMCQAWCSQSDDPEVSDGEMYVTLGIDPNGGEDAFSSDVAWSEWGRVGADYARYRSPHVLAGDKITVFVRAWNKWELSHNDIYVDDTHLIQTAPPTPPSGDCQMDWDRLEDTVRRVAREEIDRTVWASGVG